MDVRATIHEEISDGSYVCLVCHNDIGSHSPIWSCRSCFRSFDIACIRDWSKRDSAKMPKWRCPHCLTPQSQKPSSIRYHCWCGKTTNPSKNSLSSAARDPWASSMASVTDLVPPHSCGQTCSAKRRCPHPCPLVCHAGPHLDSAQCMYQGPVIKCFCGKNSEQRLCSESSYGGYSCGSPCGRKHSKCGHTCERPCHKAAAGGGGRSQRGQDSCGPCRVKVNVTCFCGRSKRTKRVCNALPAKARKHIKTHWENKFEGRLSCGKPCSALLDCGHHRCDSCCHAPGDASHECPLQPYVGETCFCGREAANRQHCTDPKLSCENTCAKVLDCGHSCPQRCHEGPCPPCETVLAEVPCRCKRTSQTTTCHVARTSAPECDKRCGALLSCRRHECQQKCCLFSPKGTGRHGSSSNQRKARTLTLGELLSNGGATTQRSSVPVSEAEEAAHLCTRICGKTLGCGTHSCVQPCHAGACPPCLAASFEEWQCPCGRTKVDPPIRCGTVMPRCRFTCHRSQSCGHTAQHECHPDSVECPPCERKVATPCRCGKSKVLVSCSKQRASDKSPQCMEPCGRTLTCGHVCTKRCCEGGDACLPCESQCGKVNDSCGHAHHAACHFPEDCPAQCNEQLVAACPCGVLRLTYTCGEALEIGCNDVCLRESYPLLVLDAYEEDKAWCTNVEIQLRAFVLQKPPSRTYWFKPMNRKRRRFVYYLLEHYGMEGQSMDEGANRSICAYRTSTTRLPRVRLSQARRKRPEVDIILGEEDDKEQQPEEGALEDAETNPGDDVQETSPAIGEEYGDLAGWTSAPRSADVSDHSHVDNATASRFSTLTRSFSVLSME